MTRADTDRAREALAHDLLVLTEKLNVRRQVGQRKNRAVDNLKGRLGMSTHTADGNGAGTESANSEVSTLLSSLREHPVATMALGYGARTIFSSWQHRHAVFSPRTATRDELRKPLRPSLLPLVRVVPTDRTELRAKLRHDLLAFALGAIAAGAIIRMLARRTREDIEEELAELPRDEVFVATENDMHAAGREHPRPGMMTGPRPNMPPVPIDDIVTELAPDMP